MPVTLTIDGQAVEVAPGQTVLEAARKLAIDIPTLCYLEKCGPLNTCLACLVKINGRMVPSCGTKAEPGMVVESETPEIHEARKTALELLFSDHVGDCLSPCHRLCPLGLNVPMFLRQIQAEKLTEAISTMRGALPLPAVLGRLCHHPCEQGCRRGNWDDPAAIREMERFASDVDLGFRREAPGEQPIESWLPPCKADTGKTVVVIGAGPTGLSAAYYLRRQGHAITVVDRHEQAGGSLRTATGLPAQVLAAELDVLRRLGIEFKLGVELGNHVRVDGLTRGFDAILLATGDPDGTALAEVQTAAGYIKVDANSCQTAVPKVFAAGSCVRSVKQLVRGMADGRAAADCVHKFVLGQAPKRPEKTFSSIMGRLSPGELRQFLISTRAGGSVQPCDRCAGHNRKEAALESARCLHCDCRSSGNCVLQHYAQAYNVDANHYRSERREFTQVLQPAGVIFEQGKCILCGICVKLTELAREPLGLTFIGRGFDVKVAAPFDAAIQDGMKTVAAECVKHCPTGALTFEDRVEVPVPAVETQSNPVEAP